MTANPFAFPAKTGGHRPRTTRPRKPLLEGLEGRLLLSNTDVSNLSGYQGETSIAINPTNPLNMIAGSNDLGGAQSGYTRAYYTKDGGVTWNTVALGNSGDPVVAFDRSGNAYFGYISTSGGIGVSKSTDGGATWSATVEIAGNAGGQDKPEITVGPDHSNTAVDRVYVSWDNNVAGDVLKVASSTDGVHWTSPKSVDGKGSEIFAQPAVLADGTLAVAWIDFSTAGTSRLKVAKSTNDGSTFGTPVVAATSRVNPFNPGTYNIPAQPTRGIGAAPSLAVDRTGGTLTSEHPGRLYLTYTDAKVGKHNDTDIMLTYSDNGGATWSTPAKVNDDKTANSQFFSWVSVDPTNGYVNLAWYDARNDTHNKKVDVYFTRSTDGGVTFAANTKVTDVASNESNKTTDDPNQYGDYMGVAAYGGLAYPVWCDTRKGIGNEEIYTVAAGGISSAVGPVTAPAQSVVDAADSQVIPATTPGRGTNFFLTTALRGTPSSDGAGVATALNATVLPDADADATDRVLADHGPFVTRRKHQG